MKVLLFIISMLWATVSLSSECGHGFWYSHQYENCFEKSGKCKQYDNTDSRTCNTGRDHLKCAWDHRQKTCYSEPGHSGNHCPRGHWYSKQYDMCYKKHGHCGQYDDTDHKTCNTRRDKLSCDWDQHDRTCSEEGHHQR